MTVALVHHADAVGPDVDPQRPLSPLGRRQAEALAEQARDFGIRPAAIWHSGKLRARQTAEPFLRLCNPFAAFKMVGGLRPDDRPDFVSDLLAAEEQDILLVSHMPLLPALLHTLAGGHEAFPLNGLVLLDRVGERQYAERWRAPTERQRSV